MKVSEYEKKFNALFEELADEHGRYYESMQGGGFYVAGR